MTEYTGHNQLVFQQSKGKNRSQWMYDQFKDKIKGDILEIGSGIGTYSEKLINDFPTSKIVLSDISENYVEDLKKRFVLPNVESVIFDLNNKVHFQRVGKNKFDTIIALNVIEHIEDDYVALDFIYEMLKQNGKALILVPAHQSLYNNIDRKVGHYRRYSKKTLLELIDKTNFQIDDVYFYNASGILGWILSGNILQKDEIEEDTYTIYDKMIPLIKIIEKYLLFRSIGISLIVILSKI